jgi:deazaflavin-dependent oxidoreductase (nitroreductase family)
MTEPDREAVLRSLLTERTVDIITTGRRSGEPRTTEIWTTVIDGQVLLCGTPNASKPGVVHQPRDWLANLVAAPEFILKLKTSVAISLSARAAPVRDPDERRRILSAPQCEYYANQVDFETAVAHSPVVTVTFTGDAAGLHDGLTGRSTVVD